MSRLWHGLGLTMLLIALGCGGGEGSSSPPAENGGTTDSSAAPAAPTSPGEGVDLGEAAPAPPAGTDSTETPEPAPAPAEGNSAAAAPASAGGVELAHISDTGALAVIVRPQRALNNPVVQGVIKEIEAADPDFKLADKLAEMRETAGVDINDIDHVLVVLDQEHLNVLPMLGMMFMMGGLGGPPMMIEEDAGAFDPVPVEPDGNCDDLFAPNDAPAADGDFPPPGDFGPGGPGGDPFALPPPTVVVKFNHAVDGKQLAAAGGGAPDERTYNGKTYFFKEGDNSAAWFRDETTAIIGAETKIRGLIDGQASAPGALAGVIAPLADRELAIALDVRPLHEFIGQMAQENPAMAALVGVFVKQVNTLTLAADLEGGNLLQVQLHALNEGAASGLQDMLGGLVQQGQAEFAKGVEQNAEFMDESEKAMLPLLQAAVSGASVSAEGAVCSVTLPRPDGLEKLPELIGPAVKKAVQEQKSAMGLNSLKQIGIAFHSYHESYTHFPANGGPGHEDVPGKGLSWRVHLLPFVGEFELFDQFNLDEPWDSEHNKALIEQMPSIYGDSADGTTTIHVFTGEGTPFNGEAGLRFADVLDGTSNTLLVAEGGPSTAAIWTKPGGFQFNPEDPLASVGDIGETFKVVMMDGFARSLPNSIDPETFRNLVRHSDGNPVQLD